MHEQDTVVRCHNVVGMGFHTLGSRKLITRLEAFALGQFLFLGAPVLVGHGDALLYLRARHVDVYHRFPDVGPQLYRQLAVAHLHIALLQVQRLAEVLHVETWRQAQSEASGFQQGVQLVERTAACHIEQHVALFHPYIHADVAASAGHRLRRVPALRGPYVVLGLSDGPHHS